MEKKNNNKGIVILLIVIIILSLCILFSTGIINFKSNTVNNNNPIKDLELNDQNNTGNNDTVDADNENNNDEQENRNYTTIVLSKEKESFDLDKLHLEFNGVNTKEGNEYFNYILDIKYDGKTINNSFFKDKANYKIWSSNMAADFKVYRIEDVYILVSFIAKQCFENEIMIFNTNGEVLKTFSNAEFSLEGVTLTINSSVNGQCMSDNGTTESLSNKYTFKINNNKIIEQ